MYYFMNDNIYYQGNKAELNFAKRVLSKLKESDKDECKRDV